MRKPNLFIVGAPKCGTTSMYNYLSEHPEIYMSEGRKEPHFFGSDLINNIAVRDERKYLELFKGANKEKYRGEASVWYLYSKKAAQEIKHYSPTSKIIIMLREPTEMMYSLYNFNLQGSETSPSFEEALNAEDQRKDKRPKPHLGHFLLYREAAHFADQVDRFIKIFGKDVHIILFDDLKNNTVETYQKLCEFLKIDSDYLPSFKTYNPHKKLNDTFLTRMVRSDKSFLNVIKKIFPWKLRRKISIWITKNFYTFDNKPRQKPDKKLILRLKKEFLADVRRLDKIVNRDLVKLWGYDSLK